MQVQYKKIVFLDRVEKTPTETFTQDVREIQILKEEIPLGLFIYARVPFLDINQQASLLQWRQVQVQQST